MKRRGAITFTFDDGYQGVYDQVLPLLERHSFPGVFAVPLDQSSLSQETGQVMLSWQEWRKLPPEHYEIAAHSVTHGDLTKLSPEKLREELAIPQQTLQVTTLVYPGGAYNDAVIKAATSLYRAARTVNKGIASLHPADPLQLPTYNFTRLNFSVHKANLLAIWACVTNQWLIETYHIVDDTSSSTHSVPLTGLKAHLAFVASLPIRVATIHDIVS